jgi:hypothetical protein
MMVSTSCAALATSPSAFPSTSLPLVAAANTQSSVTATQSKSSSVGITQRVVAMNGDQVSNIHFT